MTWIVKNAAQMGAAWLKLPTGVEPSTSHTDDELPTRMNPLEQVKTHLLPKLFPLSHTVGSPLAGMLSAGHVIAETSVEKIFVPMMMRLFIYAGKTGVYVLIP